MEEAFSRRMCLFPGLKGQDEAPPALPVGGRPCQTAGDLAEKGLRPGQDPQIGSPEMERNPEGLPLPHDKIGPCLARRVEEPQGKGLCERGDEEGAGAVDCRGQGGEILDNTEEIGALNEHGRRTGVQQSPKGRAVQLSGGIPGAFLHVIAVGPGVGPDYLAVFRVEGTGQNDPLPIDGTGRQNSRLGQGRRPVVHEALAPASPESRAITFGIRTWPGGVPG